MYCFTLSMFDSLTLNAPYPDCHANRECAPPRPCTHFDELAFTTRINSDTPIFGLSEMSM